MFLTEPYPNILVSDYFNSIKKFKKIYLVDLSWNKKLFPSKSN